ncbi:MAG: bifunctional 2-C-methyl-D-erythritol 4-phosphate cytidylyltransferase/2-C-methyl-D-erythritol 2,4-cyclodiphosphate synthase [Rhodospirillales bacterium]|nr:bifunctional 2-C-methyl-D-erythritol 4-phosphate cytidylyltransferase/2-C-methyl-D-erythritol 2,4-cyclodiphosphate synthase [Rhodospirillales bacterium]
MTCIALIVAAGRGTRLPGDVPKQYRMLDGVPIIRRSLMALLDHPGIDAVLPVIARDDWTLFADAANGLGTLPPIDGGATRQESVRLGLEHLALQAPDIVLVHDAVRPFADRDLIARVVAALADHAGAVPALPVTDTLKRETASAPAKAPRLVDTTVARDGLWRVQTPQGFRYADLLAAHRRFQGAELTDDAAVLEKAGLPVALVPGSDENVKVTTPEDLRQAERRLATGETRTGFGFDVHRFGPGDHVVIGGIKIPFTQGLEGHSDADVGLHALTDALLGAIGAGDIGVHFPPTDARWRGASSDIFLRHAGELIRERRGAIVNLDLTVICEQPRMGPHRPAIIARISDIIGISPNRVSIKATTTERLGFTGRGEGIAAQAVANVRLPFQD